MKVLMILAVTFSLLISFVAGGNYLRKVIKANNDFAFRSLKQARNLTGRGNVVIGTHSIMTSLGMLAIGARRDTRQEIRQAMQLQMNDAKMARGLSQLAISETVGNETDNYTLSIANSAWVEQTQPVCKKFERLLTRRFSASVSRVDFIRFPERSRELINGWVENQTNYEIQDLLSEGSVSSLTRFVLTNAVYFQGYWKNPFPLDDTRSGQFRACKGDGSKMKLYVDMMYQTGTFRLGRNSDVRVLELPYAGGDISMYVLLPKDRSCGGLDALESSLSAERLSTLIWPWKA